MSRARDMANLGSVTATVAELNKLDGVTASTAELNKLAGFTGVVGDLNYAKDLNATGVTATEFDFLDLGNLEFHHFSGDIFSNSWVTWSTVQSTTFESGIKMYRMGPIYIAHIVLSKNSGVTHPTGSELIINVGSNITHPSNIVYLGSQHFGRNAEDDYTGLLRLEGNGDLKINWNNSSGQWMHIHGNFIGLDVS